MFVDLHLDLFVNELDQLMITGCVVQELEEPEERSRG